MNVNLGTRSVGRVVPLLGLLTLTLAVGCSGGKEAVVQGKVTLDGVPVQKGTIRFVSTGKAAPGGGEINAGQYSVKVPVGEVKVEITAPQVVGKRKAYDTPDSPLIDVTKESIP